MRTLFTTFIFIFLLFSIAEAQRGLTCLTDTEPLRERLIKNKERLESGQIQLRGTDYYVPVAMHLVANHDGSERISEFDAMEQLCAMNEHYAPAGIVFYLKDGRFRYHDNQQLNDDILAIFDHNHLEDYLIDSALNIFIVSEISSQHGGDLPGVGFRDIGLAITNISAINHKEVASHEAGHFFSLVHTYGCWSERTFNESHPSWPVAPLLDPCGGPTEYMDGTNCDVGGDLICDTPPDYSFAPYTLECHYTGGAQDPAGVPVDPMENNMMGRYGDCTSYKFTTEQGNVMVADFLGPEKEWLRRNSIPQAVVQQPVLMHPASGTTIGTYNGIYFEWEPVPGAIYYLIEVSRFPNFGFSTTERFITDTYVYFSFLSRNTRYYWRVSAYSVTGCNPGVSEETDFYTGEETTGISQPGDDAVLRLFPNPVKVGAPVIVEYFSSEAEAIELTIIKPGGQVVCHLTENVKAGKNLIRLEEIPMPGGIYFLRADTQKGSFARKFISLE